MRRNFCPPENQSKLKAKTGAPTAHNAAICPALKIKNSAKTTAQTSPLPHKAHLRQWVTMKKTNSSHQIAAKMRRPSAKKWLFAEKYAQAKRTSHHLNYCLNLLRTMRSIVGVDIAIHTPKKRFPNWQARHWQLKIPIKICRKCQNFANPTR